MLWLCALGPDNMPPECRDGVRDTSAGKLWRLFRLLLPMMPSRAGVVGGAPAEAGAPPPFFFSRWRRRALSSWKSWRSRSTAACSAWFSTCRLETSSACMHAFIHLFTRSEMQPEGKSGASREGGDAMRERLIL